MPKKKYKKRPIGEYYSRKHLTRLGKGKEVLLFEERINALEMRKGGATYPKIAEALGVSVSKACSLVHKSLKEIYEIEAHYATELRELELQRLDTLLEGVWESAKAGHLDSIACCLRIIDQRAKLSGLLQAVTNNVFNFNQQNIDNRQLTVIELQEKSKLLNEKLIEQRKEMEQGEVDE